MSSLSGKLLTLNLLNARPINKHYKDIYMDKKLPQADVIYRP